MIEDLFSENYRRIENREEAILDVEVLISRGLPEPSLHSFKTLLDTGCSTGIGLTMDQVEKLGIRLGHKLNTNPGGTILADGSVVATDEYEVTLSFKGEKIPVTLSVVDPTIRLELSEEDKTQLEESEPIGLLGRQVFDQYILTFDGINNPKKFTFSK